MHKHSLDTPDIINLIESFVFLSENSKNEIKASIVSEILCLNQERKKYILDAVFKVFNLFGNFATEELFNNGKITFKGDNEYVYNSIAKENEGYQELVLFPGCVIAKGDNNSYINLNITKLKANDTLNIKFDFNQLVLEAIKPPAISIIINAEYYPNLLKSLYFK